MAFWVPRDCDIRVLGFDEDGPRSCLDGTAKVGGESFVPAAPQRRLVRDTFQTQLLAERRATLEILDQCGFVGPPVELFQQEHAKERVYLVASRPHVAVVGGESEIRQREC